MLSSTWDLSLLSLAEIEEGQGRHARVFSLQENQYRKAYAHCAALTAQYSRSFYMASALLPPQERQAVRALYAFCRTTDDIVDHPKEDAVGGLDRWQQVVQGDCPPPEDAVAMAWLDARSRFEVPLTYVSQLIDGLRADLSKSRYTNFDELITYCYGAASTVGLMSMHIIGFEDSIAVRYAIKLGVALQLTNILRDVAEDYARGRCYLPQDELRVYGVTEEAIAAGRVDDSWRAFMRFQIARTRRIYDEAWPGIDLLAREGQLAIAAAATFYRAILEDIEAHDYDVFSRRSYVGTWGKLRRLPGLWWRYRVRV